MIKKTLITASLIALCANSAHAQREIPTVRMCTGLIGLNYYWVGQQLQAQAKHLLNIALVTSKGALDNIQKLKDNECDVAIIQSDAMNAADDSGGIEVGKPLYKEYWHLICNTESGISRITGLNQKTPILLGDNGSGAEVTWTSFVKADPARYSAVPHQPISGQRAVGLVQQGRTAACMAVVTGLNAQGIKDVNESAKQSNNMRLIPSNDGDILKIKDAKGRYVYADDQIPSGTYSGGLQPRSILGSSVNTISVTATIAASTEFLDKRQNDYNVFLRIVDSALPGIKAKLQPED